MNSEEKKRKENIFTGATEILAAKINFQNQIISSPGNVYG